MNDAWLSGSLTPTRITVMREIVKATAKWGVRPVSGRMSLATWVCFASDYLSDAQGLDDRKAIIWVLGIPITVEAALADHVLRLFGPNFETAEITGYTGWP